MLKENVTYKVIVACLLLCFIIAGCSKKEEEIIVSHDFSKKKPKKNFKIDNHWNFDKCAGYLGNGWSRPQRARKGGFYVYSTENKAHLVLYIAERKKINVSLKYALYKPAKRPGKIKIQINRKHLTTLDVVPGPGTPVKTLSFPIPREHLTLGVNIIRFHFRTESPKKPAGKNASPAGLSIKLYDMAFSGIPGSSHVFPDCQGSNTANVSRVSRVTLKGSEKIGIVQHPNSAVAFDKCYIPAGSYLKFHLGIHPRARGQNKKVTFLVFVNENIPRSFDKGRTVFSETVILKNMKNRSWKEFEVDLSEFSGKVLSFSFNVLADVDPYSLLTVWGEPKIYSQVTQPKYNVVLITLDALRPDHVGCYGCDKKTTPNIDSFAKDAVLYSKCYSPTSWTLPSIASFYTSLYPQTHRAKCEKLKSGERNYVGPDAKIPTLPVFFKPYHYITQLISWHPFFDDSYGLSKDFDFFDGNRLNDRKTSFFAEHIQRWIKWLARETFFLHIHVVPPHSPYNAVSPYDEEFIDFNNPLLKNGDLKLFYSPYTNDLNKWGKGSNDPAVKNLLSDLYDVNLAVSDEFFGKIIRQLKESGIYDDSLIIFSSDHGEQFFEHGDTGHAKSLYAEEIRVPLLIKFPESFNISNRRVDSLVSTIDILPTILEVNNMPIPRYFQGQPLYDLPGGKLEEIKREYISLCHAWPDFLYEGIIWNDYKYIYSKVKKTEELYKMSVDPFEQDNIAGKKPQILLKLRELFKKYRRSVYRASDSKNDNKRKAKQKKDEEKLKKLKALGYL